MKGKVKARRSEALVIGRSIDRTSFRPRVFDDDEQKHQSVRIRKRSVKSFSLDGADDDVVASISSHPIPSRPCPLL
jgi:hypothetical protein